MRWMVWACALALAGCERRALPVRREAAPAPELFADAGRAAPVQIPTGCERSLAGRYRLAGRTDYRYVVRDDGRQVVAQLDVDAGGATPRMVLERTAQGFVGEVRSSAKTAAGRECPVAFRAEVIACDPGAFTVRSWDEVSLDEQCRAEPAAGPAVERTLVRE